MKILFLLVALVAAIGLLLALLKPGCGFLGFCKERRWMPVILWMLVLLAALALWRNWTPTVNEAEAGLSEQSTVIEQSNATYILEETTVAPDPDAETAAPASNTSTPGGGTAISNKNSTVPDLSETTGTLNETPSQTPRERFDEAVDDAAGVAAEAYNATREKVNEFGKAAAETWDEVRHSTGEAIEKAGDSMQETGRDMQEKN